MQFAFNWIDEFGACYSVGQGEIVKTVRTVEPQIKGMKDQVSVMDKRGNFERNKITAAAEVWLTRRSWAVQRPERRHIGQLRWFRSPRGGFGGLSRLSRAWADKKLGRCSSISTSVASAEAGILNCEIARKREAHHLPPSSIFESIFCCALMLRFHVISSCVHWRHLRRFCRRRQQFNFGKGVPIAEGELEIWKSTFVPLQALP